MRGHVEVRLKVPIMVMRELTEMLMSRYPLSLSTDWQIYLLAIKPT